MWPCLLLVLRHELVRSVDQGTKLCQFFCEVESSHFSMISHVCLVLAAKLATLLGNFSVLCMCQIMCKPLRRPRALGYRNVFLSWGCSLLWRQCKTRFIFILLDNSDLIVEKEYSFFVGCGSSKNVKWRFVYFVL